MSFSKAADWPLPTLKHCLTRLLEAEFRIKGAPLPTHIILEEMLVSMTAPATPHATQR